MSSIFQRSICPSWWTPTHRQMVFYIRKRQASHGSDCGSVNYPLGIIQSYAAHVKRFERRVKNDRKKQPRVNRFLTLLKVRQEDMRSKQKISFYISAFIFAISTFFSYQVYGQESRPGTQLGAFPVFCKIWCDTVGWVKRSGPNTNINF